ncbi:MAG: YfhO family protein [Chloroflexota bacterium]|nr:YfhO family protein [Chloroflexota bacterium]
MKDSTSLPTCQFPSLPILNFLRDLLAVVLLWVLVVVFYWRIALAGRVLAGGDVFTYFYPYWAEATRATQAGRLPLWNPYLFMGAPFLANSQVGVFYPLNWPLWFALPAHQSVHLAIVLHLCLAALNGYLWGRTSLWLGQVGAGTVGVVFALGGYLGAQVEHINQLQVLAWLPLALVLYDKVLGPRSEVRGLGSEARGPGSEVRGPGSGVAFVGLVVVVGLMLLAGHTQTAFISLVGLAAYGLGPVLWEGVRRWGGRFRDKSGLVRQGAFRGQDHLPPAAGWWRQLARGGAILSGAAGLGVAMAAVQLVPTWELTRLSVRAGGLPFNERLSFSLSPLYLARALLPGFAEPVPPEHIEHVAYIGISALVLAAVAIRNLRSPHSTLPALRSSFFLLILGLFFSLGLYNPLYVLLARFVPGFAHFRVPARWLAFYAVGVAALAGAGADHLWHGRLRVRWRKIGMFAFLGICLGLGAWGAFGGQVGQATLIGWAVAVVVAMGLLFVARRAPRLGVVGLLALLVVELFAAGSALPHARATAPQAFTSQRPAIAHLLAASLPSRGGAGARFLSMSDITFDPGDMPEIEIIYGPQLSADALYDYVVATKHKEVLSPNLPLVFGLPAMDGFGGGILPLARYVTLQQVFLPKDKVSIDGRLREHLTAIPDGRWLSLFNVRHVISDKLHDAWLDGVFYDLQFGAQLARGEVAAVAHVPRFEATALGLVSYLRGGAALPDGTVVGHVNVGFSDGLTRTFELRAGQHTAEGGQMEGDDHVTRLRWREPATAATVVVQATLPEGELVVRGVSLIDERTGGFQSLVLSDRGDFCLAHSGDVKIYENLDVLPRAFVVHKAVVVADDEMALARMSDAAFDPAAEVVLVGSGPEGALLFQYEEGGAGQGLARVAHYAPERVVVEVDAESPGYLVLTDAWYPGWEATVDGEVVEIQRADILFRAVAVDAGSQRIVFTFCPVSLRAGAAISLAGLIGLVIVAAWVLTLSKAGRGVIMGTVVGNVGDNS